MSKETALRTIMRMSRRECVAVSFELNISSKVIASLSVFDARAELVMKLFSRNEQDVIDALASEQPND
ncbi:MAG: hypothetical protein AAF141_13860 [Pseudomonadota bacterium]